MQCLYFICPIAAALIIGLGGDMRTRFPIVFLILIGSIIAWTILIFRAIGKEKQVYDYYNGDDLNQPTLDVIDKQSQYPEVYKPNKAKNENAPKSDIANIRTLMMCEFVTACVLVAFYLYYSVSLINSDPSTLIFFTLSAVLFIIYIGLTCYKIAPGTSCTKRKEDIKIKSVRPFYVLTALISLVCLIIVLNISLLLVNSTYIRGQFTRESRVSRAQVETNRVGRHAKDTEYYVYFETINIEKERETNYPTPDVPFIIRPIVDVLPYISGYNIFGDLTMNDDIYQISACESEYEMAQKNDCIIRIGFEVGYYGTIYRTGHEILTKQEIRENG